jgi:hypothetical protein
MCAMKTRTKRKSKLFLSLMSALLIFHNISWENWKNQEKIRYGGQK